MVKVYHLNAFAKTKEGGNPAGVCLDADGLSAQAMQAIAAKVGYSETAFVQKSDKADYRVMFFTPTNEIALCGHATIATFFLLAQLGKISQGKYKQETKAGILDIVIEENQKVYMHQQQPTFMETFDKKIILDCLQQPEEALDTSLPVEMVSTGVPTIIVPVVSLKTLHAMKPSIHKIKDLTVKHHNSLFHVFCRETNHKASVAQGRMFAPAYGIDEESATGMANGALACYMFKHGLVIKPDNLIFEQGYAMNRPSEILGKLKVKDNAIQEVIIGGTAQLVKEMDIVLD